MTTFTESLHPLEFVVSEASGLRSRHTGTLAAGNDLDAGAVLGQVTKARAAAAIPAITNADGSSANGTMTLLSAGPDVQIGNYVVACVTAVAHGGVFSVTAPDGTALPNFTMGTETGATAAYSSTHIRFSLTDGSADFKVGDKFTVAVTANATPVKVGTGDGVMSAVSIGPDAQFGTYRVVCTTPPGGANHGGTFTVFDPTGATIGTVVIADSAGATASFVSQQVNFTVADGGTNYAANDYFHIIVARGSGAFTVVAPTAVDGSATAAGILAHPIDATSAAKACVVLVRDAEVNGSELAWPSTMSSAQIAAATEQLAARGLIVR